MSQTTDKGYIDAITKSTAILLLFIVKDGVLAVILEEERLAIVLSGLMFAFSAFLVTLVAVILARAMAFKVEWRGLLEAAAGTVGAFILSEAIILLIPEDQRGNLYIVGSLFAFIVYALIIIGRFLYEMAGTEEASTRFLTKI